MGSLREQAMRLMRTRWAAPQKLAEELYLILLQHEEGETGPITVNLGDDQEPSTKPGKGTTNPLDPWNWDNFDLPDFDWDGQGPEQEVTEEEPQDGEEGQPQRTTKKTTYYQWVRNAFPGQVTSGSGTLYEATIYPNGVTQDGLAVKNVTQLGMDSGETIPAGTWAWVYRATKLKAVVEAVYEGGKEVSRETKVSVVSTEHLMIVPVWL